MTLTDVDLSDGVPICKNNIKTAYPIHQFINIFSIESVINDLDESVCLKAAEQIPMELPLLSSTAPGTFE